MRTTVLSVELVDILGGKMDPTPKNASDYVIGADEVGYGAWASGMLIGAVLAPADWSIPGLRDSKKLSPKKREKLDKEIRNQTPFIHWHLEWRWPKEIDERGVGRCRIDAIESAVKALLKVQPNALVLVDGDVRLTGFAYKSEPKADDKYPAVMAASILAKVARDKWMTEIGHAEYPEYGWNKNMGYGTAAHKKALEEYGACKYHRYSYAPIVQVAQARNEVLTR